MPPLHFLGEHKQDKADQIRTACTASSQGNAHLSRGSPRAPPWPPSELRRRPSASPAVTPQSVRSDPHQSFPPSPAPQQTTLSCHALNPSAALCIPTRQNFFLPGHSKRESRPALSGQRERFNWDAWVRSLQSQHWWCMMDRSFSALRPFPPHSQCQSGGLYKKFSDWNP